MNGQVSGRVRTLCRDFGAVSWGAVGTFEIGMGSLLSMLAEAAPAAYKDVSHIVEAWLSAALATALANAGR